MGSDPSMVRQYIDSLPPSHFAARKEFLRMLSTHFAPWFRARGYSRKSQAFIKDLGSWELACTLQNDRYNTAAHSSFTVNVGATDTSRLPAWLKSQRGGIYIPFHVNYRISQLFAGTHRDYWWYLGAGVDVHALATEIQSVLESLALPFLTWCAGSDCKDVFDELKPPEFAFTWKIQEAFERRRRAVFAPGEMKENATLAPG